MTLEQAIVLYLYYQRSDLSQQANLDGLNAAWDFIREEAEWITTPVNFIATTESLSDEQIEELKRCWAEQPLERLKIL